MATPEVGEAEPVAGRLVYESLGTVGFSEQRCEVFWAVFWLSRRSVLFFFGKPSRRRTPPRLLPAATSYFAFGFSPRGCALGLFPGATARGVVTPPHEIIFRSATCIISSLTAPTNRPLRTYFTSPPAIFESSPFLSCLTVSPLSSRRRLVRRCKLTMA